MSMDVQGYPLTSMDERGYPWMSMDADECPWILSRQCWLDLVRVNKVDTLSLGGVRRCHGRPTWKSGQAVCARRLLIFRMPSQTVERLRVAERNDNNLVFELALEVYQRARRRAKKLEQWGALVSHQGRLQLLPLVPPCTSTYLYSSTVGR